MVQGYLRAALTGFNSQPWL